MSLSPPRRLDRTLLRPWVLLRLRTRPRHAYELASDLRSLGLPAPDRPALYRLLHSLEGEGLVRSKPEPGAGGPARRVYRVTAKGTRQLRRDAEALDELQQDLRRFRIEWEALETGRR